MMSKASKKEVTKSLSTPQTHSINRVNSEATRDNIQANRDTFSADNCSSVSLSESTNPDQKMSRGTAVVDGTDESESEGDCPVDCSGHEHLEKVILDEVFEYPVNTLYKMIFTNHPFARKFQSANNCTGLELSDWSKPDPDGDSFRISKYTITYQQMGTNRPGACYVIDSEARTAGIPYSESFYLLNRFCLTRRTKYTSKLTITSSIIYTKKVWSMIRSFIDKNVDGGTSNSYALMETKAQDVVPTNVYTLVLNAEVITKLMVVFKLTRLQEKADSLFHHKHGIFNTDGSASLADKWQPLFESQQQQQEAEMEVWNKVLLVSGKILATMHKTITVLQINIGQGRKQDIGDEMDTK
ncbi:hypothetical protein LSH36_287g00040 [Paralvinella palmiformis]|uniref:VASt domain-containing protein n=1 Tax=Paralvinella palmiformis TaxID=53620 RepID=A0AAD9JIS0_9ANNE|nr:hypothetical protein LSH36_287g00040 [Paralvinella palmiformis]